MGYVTAYFAWMTDGEVVPTTEAETECSVIVMTMSKH